MAVAGNCEIHCFARAGETANLNAGRRCWSRGAVDRTGRTGVGGISSGALKLRSRSHLFNGAHNICTAACAGECVCICWDPCRSNFDRNGSRRTTAGRCGRHRTVETPASESRLWWCADTSRRRHSLSGTYSGSAFSAGAFQLRSECGGRIDFSAGFGVGGNVLGNGIGLLLSQAVSSTYCRSAFSAGAFQLRSACGRRSDFSAGFGVGGNVLGNGIGLVPSQGVRSSRHCRRRYAACSQERPQPVGQKERSAAANEKRVEEENDGVASRSRTWKVEALRSSGDDTGKEESDVPKPLILLPISSVEEFEAALAEGQQSKRVVIIEWMAQWCRKCIYLKPKLEKLALEYSKYKFYEVDVNNVPGSLVKRSGITKMPTIQLWKDGEKQAEVSGGSEAWVVIDKVKDMIRNG